MAVDPTRNSSQSLLATFNQAVWSVFQSLMTIPLVFLGANTVAVLAVNLLYDPTSLRPRYQWQGVVARNAIFAVLFLIVFFVCRSKARLREQLPARFTYIKARLLRIGAWILLALLAAIETISLATNLLFDQELTLIKTPSQTVNLLHSVFLGAVGTLILYRTRAAKSEEKFLAADLRSLITGALWYGFRKSFVYSILYAMVFAGSAFVIFKWFVQGLDSQSGFLISHFTALAAIYIVAGLLCGAHAGAVAAIRDKTPDLLKVCDALGAPLIRAIVANIALDQVADRDVIGEKIERLKASMQSPAGGMLGKLAQRRLSELVQGGGMIELIEQWSRQDNPTAKESVVDALREKLIHVTTDEMSRRLSVVRWVIYVMTAAIFMSPALFLTM